MCFYDWWDLATNNSTKLESAHDAARKSSELNARLQHDPIGVYPTETLNALYHHRHRKVIGRLVERLLQGFLLIGIPDLPFGWA